MRDTGTETMTAISHQEVLGKHKNVTTDEHLTYLEIGEGVTAKENVVQAVFLPVGRGRLDELADPRGQSAVDRLITENRVVGVDQSTAQ